MLAIQKCPDQGNEDYVEAGEKSGVRSRCVKEGYGLKGVASEQENPMTAPCFSNRREKGRRMTRQRQTRIRVDAVKRWARKTKTPVLWIASLTRTKVTPQKKVVTKRRKSAFTLFVLSSEAVIIRIPDQILSFF